MPLCVPGMGTYPYKGKDNTRRNRVSLAGESPVPASCRSRLVSRKGVRCEARSESSGTTKHGTDEQKSHREAMQGG